MGRDAVARNQRSRLYGGMIECVAQRGYQATTVAHVIALAGVSRRAFYELFPNKEQCFLGAHDIVVAHARKSVLDAWQGERGWINRMHAACKAMLDGAAKEPKGPHLVLVDSLGIGPRARERMQLAGLIFERIVGTALTLAPPDVCFTQLTSRAVVAGVRRTRAVVRADRRSARLDRVLPHAR
jgi:AcrR family transcriptional regulator